MFGDFTIAYFGVNPSTADEVADDHTVSKWIGFTKINNGRRFLVGNAFAYRSTDVTKLSTIEDPVGADNDFHIKMIVDQADLLVPCWGSRNKVPKELHFRFEELLHLLIASHKPLKAFGTTETGDPKHPLMLPYSTELIDYSPSLGNKWI